MSAPASDAGVRITAESVPMPGNHAAQDGTKGAAHAASAHRLDRLHRTASGARVAEARLSAARAAAPADFAPDKYLERGDWRYRPAAKHVSGPAGRGCRHPLGWPRASDVWR